MPRQPRIDIPGLLHHVIFRGIEKCAIVKDDTDRRDFVARLMRLSGECDICVYAWALMDNHAHLLIRSSDYGLPRFMRRLLTGHAITFNLRYQRHGHLFQNRYKSIVCDEDSYFLELVRYIHLNPIRAGVVADMTTLATYPWCGHGAVLNKKINTWQCRDEVLLYFGLRKKRAIAKYKQFVADGLDQGQRPELSGGGLRRSQQLSAQPDTPPKAYDERILGNGDFVEQILLLNEPDTKVLFTQKKLQQADEFIEQICSRATITQQELQSGGRRRAVSNARAVIAVELVQTYGWTIAATAKRLGVSSSAISKNMAKTQR